MLDSKLDSKKSSFDATAYWNNRYETIDVTRSGHIDLPADYNNWLYRRKQRHVAIALAKVGGSLRGSKILEVAAGSGAWMNFWDEHDVADYFGIDLSERAIDGLRKRFPRRRFLQHDLNAPDLQPVVGTGYDCVAAIDVLYHVIDDARFRALIKELASVLKPGGVMIVHDQFLHGPPYDFQYIRWRSLVEYEEALAMAGFEIVYRRPTFFFMIQAIDLSGVIAKLMVTLWDHFTYPIIRRFPKQAGAVGYFVDSVVCALLKEGPSMEVMVCRKRG